MGRVRVLPETLAHQIAAGEVVERPASVVKELLENALDAGTSRIEIVVRQGGKKRIEVSDDGCGMSAEDAELAFSHHATSKIASLDDLGAIRTLGFRGEALPSIASVARVRLRTRASDAAEDEPGTEIVVEGGQSRTQRPVSWPQGTQVVVEDLFFNVPARRKFLKTDTTEMSHISRQVTVYSLANPHVEFQLMHGGRCLLQAPRVTSLRERVHQTLGDDLLDHLVDVDYEKEGVRVSGLTGLPHEQRNSARSLFLFVNGRMVRDRLLTHAVRQAYRDLMPSASYPAAVLFVELEPDRLDVNVHPAKTEIRFRHPQAVHTALLHALEAALHQRPGSLSDLARDLELGSSFRPRGHSQSPTYAFQRHSGGALFEARGAGYPAPEGGGDRWDRSHATPDSGHAAAAVAESPPPFLSGADPHAANIPDTNRFSVTPVILGQFVESFIVATDREGVLVVDQHVAHERILYDRALAEMSQSQAIAVQQLLVPQTVELDSQQLAVVEPLVETLQENGFLVEPFGDKTLMIRGIPAIASEADAIKVVEGVIEELERLDTTDGDPDYSVDRLRETIAIGMACQAAIKINTPLGARKMQWLLDALFETSDPYTCPHGRPIVLRLGLEEVLKGFKRI